jgi:hypothetical protein
MKKFPLWIAAASLLLANLLYGQSLTGTWQGTLKPGPQDLRIVFKISPGDDKLQTVMYSIDQPAPLFPPPVSRKMARR